MNTPEKPIEFSFDEWAELYKKDPKEFERLKEIYFEQEIKKMCRGDEEAEKRCRNINFSINLQLSRIKNPLARLAKMEQMLYEQGLFPLNDALQNLQRVLRGEPVKETVKKSAEIIDFTERKTKYPN